MELSERIARDVEDLLGSNVNFARRRQIAAIIDRHLASQSKEIWNEAISLIPTSWVDPLLSGTDSALPLDKAPWDCRDIERLLRTLKARLEAARDAPQSAAEKQEAD